MWVNCSLRQRLLLSTLFQGLCVAFKTLQPSESFPLWKAGWFAVVIDVRTTAEYASGHIPGAYLVDSLASTQVIPSAFGVICKQCPIAVYCRTGSRSMAAAKVLEAAGFTAVYDIQGVQQLFAHGFPEEKGVPSSPVQLTHLCSEALRACQSSSLQSASTLTIGSAPAYWSAIPSSPNAYWVTEGDALRFSYSSFHNVWLMASQEAFETCNFVGAKELAGNFKGGGSGFSPNTHDLVAESPGVMYIACEVSSHCHAGQKIQVMVSPRLNLPPVPSAPLAPAGSCYYYVTSCPQQATVTPNKWMRDSWGEAYKRSGTDRTACEQTRRDGFAAWCGIQLTAVTMQFNAPNVCCSAMIASCLACQKDVTEEVYCQAHPATQGCFCSKFAVVGDACVDERAAAACKELEDSGCKDIQILESCPLQFRC